MAAAGITEGRHWRVSLAASAPATASQVAATCNPAPVARTLRVFSVSTHSSAYATTSPETSSKLLYSGRPFAKVTFTIPMVSWSAICLSREPRGDPKRTFTCGREGFRSAAGDCIAMRAHVQQEGLRETDSPLRRRLRQDSDGRDYASHTEPKG